MFICAPLFGAFLHFPKSKTIRRGGRREKGRRNFQGGFPPQCCWAFTSLLTQGLAARAGYADPGWWEPRQEDWLDFVFQMNEEVEHQCQKTIQQLETILGEPLQSYFWNSGFGYFVLCSETDCFSFLYSGCSGPYYWCLNPTWMFLPNSHLIYASQKLSPGSCNRIYRRVNDTCIFIQTAVFVQHWSCVGSVCSVV